MWFKKSKGNFMSLKKPGNIITSPVEIIIIIQKTVMISIIHWRYHVVVNQFVHTAVSKAHLCLLLICSAKNYTFNFPSGIHAVRSECHRNSCFNWSLLISCQSSIFINWDIWEPLLWSSHMRLQRMLHVSKLLFWLKMMDVPCKLVVPLEM